VDEVWGAYPEVEIASPPFESVRYPEVTSLLQSLHREHQSTTTLSQVGSTLEGRTIWTLQLGRGPRRVLVWSRQHGDEKISTAALLNSLAYLLSENGYGPAREILDGATLLVVPMVNPDGVHRFIRRNSMGIDPNRDAQKAITAEGRALRRAKEAFNPTVAFNLHDMYPRKSTSTEKNLVALALQAGPFDEWGSDNEVRRVGKRLCARMAEAAGRFAHGHITRYDSGHMPQAFGDYMMRGGVSTVLVESGGWWEPGADAFVARLHFLALLAGLHAAATGSMDAGNASFYDSLPLDSGRPYLDLVIRDPIILDGSGHPRLRAGIGINHDRFFRRHPHEEPRPLGTIRDLGDLSEDKGKTEIDGRGVLAVPGLVAIAPGTRLDAPEDADRLVPFLEAGFTSVVGGCGPFREEKDFAAWKSAVSGVGLPVHFLAFEVLHSIEAVMDRYGQTEAFGVLVPDLAVKPDGLLAALHLFHPAAHSAVPEDQEELNLKVDLLLHAEGHPRTNRLHLLVRPMEEGRETSPGEFIPAKVIRGLFEAFIRHPDQIGVTVDTSHRVLGFFPAPPYIGGLGGGRPPAPEFLSRTARTLKCTTEEGLANALSRLTRQPAIALGLQETGVLRQEYRADIVLFDCGAESSDGSINPGALGSPVTVIVNGLTALDSGAPTGRNGGLLILR